MSSGLEVRMKDVEMRSRSYLGTRSYVIIRLDGAAFHSYTRGLVRPFDKGLAEDMDETATYLCQNIQGARCAYVQSDEISILVSDIGSNETQPLYKNQIQKIVSKTAGMASAKFNILRMARKFCELSSKAKSIGENIDYDDFVLDLLENSKLAHFDSRVLCFSDPVEAHNCLLWRQNDATKNSISMAAQSVYSHKELNKKNGSEMQEMLFQKGINWNDYPERFKRGALIRKVSYTKEIYSLNGNVNVVRSKWCNPGTPIFSKTIQATYSCIPVKFDGEVISMWDLYNKIWEFNKLDDES